MSDTYEMQLATDKCKCYLFFVHKYGHIKQQIEKKSEEEVVATVPTVANEATDEMKKNEQYQRERRKRKQHETVMCETVYEHIHTHMFTMTL